MRKRYKSLLSWALAAALTAGLLPAPVAYAADTANIKTVMLGTSGIQNPLPADPSDNDNHAPKSYIYFGINQSDPDKRPILWRVLDAEKASADVPGGQGGTVPGMFLLSEYALDKLRFHPDYSNDPPNKWEGSNAESWCNTFAESTGGYFTDLESGAMLTTSKKEKEDTLFTIPWVDSTREANKAFFLSAQELSKYVAESNGASSLITKQYHSSGGAVAWWLLSPPYGNDDRVGAVGYDGGVLNIIFYDGGVWARPALNLDSKQVLFTVPAGGVTGMVEGELTAVTNYDASGAREWKLTLKEESRDGFAVDHTGGLTMVRGTSKEFTYSGAKTDANEYISAILVDKSTNEVAYYGKLAQAQANGTATLTLPDTMAAGEYDLYLFNEQENGAQKTNLASDFRGKAISLTVLAELSDGAATRTSATDASITFTSSAAGTYSYLIQDPSEPQPTENDIKTNGTSDTCDVGKNTISVTNLAGNTAKKVYIVVNKSVSGADTNVLAVDIPAYVPPVYRLDVNLDGGNGADKSGSYEGGAKIALDAGEKRGYDFAGWTSSNGGNFEDASAAQTNFTMPRASTTVTATWQAQPAPPTTPSTDAPPPSTYAPSINQTDGGRVTISPSRPQRGDTVTITATPDAGKRVSFVGVTDRNGNVIEVTDNGNGTWTYTQPNSIVTVGVVFRDAAEPWHNPFGDVQESDWFYSAVEYVITHDLMNGVSFSTFAPDSEATRAMLWAILARMDGASVAGADWMAQAGAWATGAGVSDGTNPAAPLTREQLVTMPWRAAGSPPPRGDLSAFADADGVSEYARAPMAWATENGIVSGMGGNRLAPQAGATRAQLAAMLQRYDTLR